MTLTPTAAETRKIQEIIADDSYKDDYEMAKAVIRSAWESFQARDLWTVLVYLSKNSRIPIVYGLEATEAAARNFAMSLDTGGTYKLLPVRSMTGFVERARELEDEWGDSGTKVASCRCSHYQYLHNARSYKYPKDENGNKVKTISSTTSCVVSGCNCKAFKETE